MSASDAYDVVVIGAGAGGMTAAAVAAAEGLRVLVIEKTEFVGGTTSWSGGMVWIPANSKMKQTGLPDSLSDAASYLASTVPEIENADLRDTFLKRGPEAVEYLQANTELQLQPVKPIPTIIRRSRAPPSAAACWSPSPSMAAGSEQTSGGCVRRCRNSPCSAG